MRRKGDLALAMVKTYQGQTQLKCTIIKSFEALSRLYAAKGKSTNVCLTQSPFTALHLQLQDMVH